MSKQYSDNLFRVIKSLSKSEKRSFKLFMNRIGDKEEKKIISIFDHITKQKIYNEKKILSKEKSLKSEQMPNLKAHLYIQIMKCLAASPSLRTAELKVTSLLDYARILYNRCLYDECLKMLEKAKKSAMENDTKILLFEILELEKLALRQTVHEGNEARVESIITETERTAQSIQNINIFSNLSLKLNSLYQRTGFIRNNSDYEKVKRFFESSLPEYEEKQLSFHEKLYLYYSFTGYFYFIQDFKSGSLYAKKWVNLFESNPQMIYHKTELYIRALNNLLASQSKLHLYEEFYDTHKKLIALKRDPKLSKTENINLNLFKTIYLHEINRHYMLGEFTSGTRIVKKLESELNSLIPKLDRHTVLIFYYKIACLYFGASNFRTAIKWLNKIVNEKEIALREDIHSFTRILRLISYFELGDEELIEHNIKSTYRFLLKKGTLQHYQYLILNFLKNLKHNSTQKKLITAFSNLKKEMRKLENSRYEKRAFLYFDIISWLESKIENRPVEDVIKQKAGRKLQSSNIYRTNNNLL
jgi:hypothetical protein